MGRRREEDPAPNRSIGVNDDELGPARKICTILLMYFYMLPYYQSETRLEDDLPVEYKSAGRGTYGGGAADADGVAIVTGGHGGAPDCAGGADRHAEGPGLGTVPVARGGSKVSSVRQVTARRNRPHRSTILFSVLWCCAGAMSW